MKAKRTNTTITLTVGLKKSNTGENILKSFYSNRKRKTFKTAGSSNNRGCGANPKSFSGGKNTKKSK